MSTLKWSIARFHFATGSARFPLTVLHGMPDWRR
jgi:hypothetical protein